MEWKDIWLLIVDKVLIGVLLLIVGLWINRKLSEYKVGLEEGVGTRVRIAERRLPSYRELWAITKPTSRSNKTTLTLEQRRELYNELCDWYYKTGNGIFLSHTTRDSYLSAREELLNEIKSEDEIKELFSKLRTEIKNEIGIYGKNS